MCHVAGGPCALGFTVFFRLKHSTCHIPHSGSADWESCLAFGPFAGSQTVFPLVGCAACLLSFRFRAYLYSKVLEPSYRSVSACVLLHTLYSLQHSQQFAIIFGSRFRVLQVNSARPIPQGNCARFNTKDCHRDSETGVRVVLAWLLRLVSIRLLQLTQQHREHALLERWRRLFSVKLIAALQ